MALSLLQRDTVALDDPADAIVIIDQTRLPGELITLSLTTQQEIFTAIRTLQVRGAPAIGVTAAFAAYLSVKHSAVKDWAGLLKEFRRGKDYLAASRPTAVNLTWAHDRMERVLTARPGAAPAACIAALREEALAIYQEDIAVCEKLGEHGLSLVQPGWGLLTHCNAGHLATVRRGTATAPIYLGQERGYDFHVFVDETRPLLQGARLTASELTAAGVNATLICDNMAAAAMAKGWIQAVFVGCDRVAANGDAANKIGTLGAAVLARHFGVPFYVVAPSSTVDFATPTGADIVIEERDGSEVTSLWYEKPMAPAGIDVWDPAFDVTPHDLITAIVTEYGVARPPFGRSLAALLPGGKGEKA